MFNVADSCALATLAVLCLTGAPVHAQVAPLRYWIPGGPFGLGNGADQNSDTYGSFSSFNAGDAAWRTSYANGFFVGSERGNFGLSGFNQAGSAANFSALSYDSTQFGYTTKAAGGLPVTFFAGFDTLKYGNGIGSSLAPLTSTATPGYGAFAGVEFKPTPNLSLSFGAGFSQQQSGRMDSDINSSMLPGESPVLGGLRR
ncbi:hypothetical protein IVA87_06600 [Bradyrhizobium sp. 147]|uniref:hypothetical protein n=1 Tax=unclassified Bradyrhizobium TaxID=2631580 RepID=UPI001FF9C779|nr:MULTISPECIES: hypothetical protein [unclassified Bradyrhizobium]MCK1545157.1 hypothetical protein [Bradyrhizobium sp. 179]MCK1626580.1 hypothetical protein [Bradyrhizobium sp. 160]MCK1679152.1 hypothetical protein [Bradyrhizobium sp. 147]